MAIFAVLNQKGGVGKTTTAVTIASALARQDYSALLIDLDSQGNVADSLGLETGDDLRRLLSPDLLLPLAQVVKPSEHLNLDVIRADKTTAVLKQILAGVDLREYVLADALAHNDYDVIVFDCAPSVDLFHIAALVAADFIVIPTRLDKLAVNGVRDALQTLASLRRISHCQQARVVLGLRVVQTGPEFDPNGPRELKVLKTNLGSYQDPIGFEFAPLEPAGVMLKWDTKAPKTYREPTQRDECKEWLEDFLKAHPEGVKVKEVIEAAKEEGLKQSMVYQVRKELGAQIVNTDGHKSPANRWKWSESPVSGNFVEEDDEEE